MMISYRNWGGWAAFLVLTLYLSSCGTKRVAMTYSPQPPQAEPVMPAADTGAGTATTSAEETEKECEPEVHPTVRNADPDTWLGHIQQQLDSLCHSAIGETSQMGIYIYDLTSQQPVYSYNAWHRMRPASCEKLVTSITLLDHPYGLRPLATEVIATGQLAEGVLEGNLYLTGDMDPLLTRACLDSLATALHQAGIDSVAGQLCELMPPYEVLPYGWGWCWDDDYGPLAAHLLDGMEGIQTGWTEALTQAGIALQSERVAEVNQREGQTIMAFRIEHNIDDVLEPVLKKSDNICAECLFHRLTALAGKKETARDQAVEVIDSLLLRLGLNPKDYLIADGSGLSLYNYVTPHMLVTLLNHAHHTESIRQHLVPCLPIAGVDGTLKRRMTGTAAQGNVRAKTGTVEGVSSLSGYLTAANGHLFSFSIINQGVARTRTGQNFQDAVCLLLCE
ncbi:MAG: D-alanyl-D-alanine carboxypeptidase/D-alanyl-D-alanine-endopeptidase [Bacteroidaceae bacterium]|nr:D-alanyl-D-alanine carboxypeptidase/D-alanyl-D-alanine-endopeptidase [Bacteroidaceae bacterium]